MIGPRHAAVPNLPCVVVLLRLRLKTLRVPCAIAIALSCAPPPAQKPVEIPRPSPPVVLTPFEMDTALSPDHVPSFQQTPLVAWGPPPSGVPHPERTRTYDLQHQSTTVRFDWERKAVVGTTTLQIAGLPGAPPLSSVAIDAVDMTFKRVATGTTALRFDYDDRVLLVHLAGPLRSGETTSISIDYDAENREKGAYFKSRHTVWTLSWAQDTRYWVPTYDFPNDKTTWEFRIWTAKGERALSNGRLAGIRAVGDSMEYRWALEKPAPTYLMTAVVGEYTVLQGEPWRKVPIGYWTYPDSVEAARRGFRKTPAAVALYSRKTGVPYPWSKYDQIVIPDFELGGMENVTATSESDVSILHPAWAEPQRSSDGLVAHELAHQWYGNLVTAKDWSDAWLSEGFATFMEQIFRETDKGYDEAAMRRLGA